MTDWLTGLNEWISDWLTDWLTDQPTDWFYRLDWLPGWLFDWLTDWLTICLTDWLSDCLTDFLSDWLSDWLTDWLTEWVSEWLTDWLTDWLTECLTTTDWLNGWLAECVTCKKKWCIRYCGIDVIYLWLMHYLIRATQYGDLYNSTMDILRISSHHKYSPRKAILQQNWWQLELNWPRHNISVGRFESNGNVKGLRLFTDIIVYIDGASCKDLVSSTGRQLVIWKKENQINQKIEIWQSFIIIAITMWKK